jgi:hypothetical protein
MNANRVVLPAILACAIGALIVVFAEERNVVRQLTPKAVQLRIEGEFPSLGGATEWLRIGRKMMMSTAIAGTILPLHAPLQILRAWRADVQTGGAL